MPYKPKRQSRKYRKYLKGIIDYTLALGTLAPKVVTGSQIGDTVVDRTFVSSLVGTYSLSEFSNNAGDGPITVGIAHGDYSVAEIEAFIENADSWNEGDLIAQEIAKRKIRIVGTFDKGDLGVVDTYVLNDGKPIKTKLGWILNSGATLSFWAYNQGSGALDTTDPQFFVKGHANLWPR